MTGIISSYTSSGVNSGCMSGISNTIQNQVSGTSNSVQDVSVSGRRYDTFEKSQTSSESSAISYSANSAKSTVSNTGTSTAVTYGSNSAASPSAKLDSDNRELTDSEYEKLAADLAGIDIDAYGNRNCTYEETLKFGEILTRLHKQKITVNTSQQEAAAAAAGVGYKNDSFQFDDFEQFCKFTEALFNLWSAKINSKNDVVYGPYEFNSNKDIGEQNTIILPPSTGKTANTIKAEYKFIPPDSNNEFGYVVFNEEKYPLLYMKLEKK
ncbi:MAG: hypothetical protein IJZ72_01265 [Oscillospiraceae bacterium]|nr:hypothetical protein [Oscillospiraceae bacterium]